MANTWVEIMKRLPDDLLKPAEKAQVCYHVIVKETVAEQKLQRAAEALALHRHLPHRDPTLSEQRAIVSLFKMVLAAATEPAGSSRRDLASASGTESQPRTGTLELKECN